MSLSLHAEVGSRFVESHFDLPAPWKPLDDLFSGNVEIGAQQGLRLEALLGIADNHPADGHHGFSAVAPDSGAGGDFDFSFLFAIPLLHREPLPTHMFVFGNLFQGRQALALFARATYLPRLILGWFIESRIHAKAHDHRHWVFELAQPKKQLNYGKTTVGHDDQLALGQPAAGLEHHLTSPFGELLMPASLALIVPFRRRQHREKGQCPSASSPRNRRQQHQAQPTQSTGFHKVTVTGTDRIPINPFGFDLGPPTPLNGIVQAQDHWTAADKGVDQQTQQDVGGFQARPLRSIENAMIVLKMLLQAQARGPQSCCHGSFRRRQDRPDQQDLCMLPNSIREQSRKGSQDRDIVRMQGRHQQPLGRVFALAYLASR